MDHNVKLIDQYRRDGGRWYVKPNDARMLDYVKQQLAEHQTAEPSVDWHLETRGIGRGWHRWED